MDSSTIKFITLHHIDINNEKVDLHLPSTDNDDLIIYVNDLLNIIKKKNDHRLFKFPSNSTEVKNCIDNFFLTEVDVIPNSTLIASRLLRMERSAQEKYGHLQDIQKGSLIQSLIEENCKRFILIAKIDLNPFLDEIDLKKKNGLPFERYLLKSCLLEFTVSNELLNVALYDSTARIANYWYKEFLEVEELNTNEHNTEASFTVIDNEFNNRLKKKYPSDHTYLRNNLISYYRNHDEFVFNEMISFVFGDYKPQDPGLDIGSFKDTIRKLPQKKNFDEKFSIVHKLITARYRRIIKLTDQIELNLKSDIENLEDIIVAVIEKGEKLIKIKSESGYDAFKRNKDKK